MKYRDINLIPDKILYKNQIFFTRLLMAAAFTSAGLLLLAILYLPVYNRTELQQKVNALSERLDSISLQELNSAEADLVKKNQEKKDLDRMLKSVTGTDLKTTELISKVTSKMPAGIVTENIMFQPELAEMTFRAVSTNREDISLFLKRLYNETLFTGINVSEIRGSGTRYSFSVVIKVGGKE